MDFLKIVRRKFRRLSFPASWIDRRIFISKILCAKIDVMCPKYVSRIYWDTALLPRGREPCRLNRVSSALGALGEIKTCVSGQNERRDIQGGNIKAHNYMCMCIINSTFYLSMVGKGARIEQALECQLFIPCLSNRM